MTHTVAPRGFVATQPIHAGDDELHAFYARTLADSERVFALHRWRKDRDRSGEVEVAVARNEGLIVGALAAVPLPLTHGGRQIDAAYHIDTIVDPATRRRGIGRRLLDVAGADRELVIAKGTLEHMYRLRKSSGYQDVGNSRYLVRVLRSQPGMGGARRRSLSPLLYWYNKMRGADIRRSTMEVHEVAGFDRAFDDLAERLALTDEMRPYKDSRYLNWRYGQCPHRSYTVFRADDARDLRGAAVVRLPAGRSHDAWLVDMILDNRDADTAHGLLNRVFALCREQGCAAVRTFATSAQARSWLQRRGFLSISETPHFTYRVHCAKPTVPFDRVSWDFWHGDADNELHDGVSAF